MLTYAIGERHRLRPEIGPVQTRIEARMDREQHLPPNPAAPIDFSVLNYIIEALFWVYTHKSRERFDMYKKRFSSTVFLRPLWRDLQDAV